MMPAVPVNCPMFVVVLLPVESDPNVSRPNEVSSDADQSVLNAALSQLPPELCAGFQVLKISRANATYEIQRIAKGLEFQSSQGLSRWVDPQDITVINLCDGDDTPEEDWPGSEVIELLEAFNLRFTGPCSAYDRWSITKLAMKATWDACGIPTARHLVLVNGKDTFEWNPALLDSETGLPSSQQLARALKESGIECPVICKLAIGGGSLGIAPTSVCANPEEILSQCQRLCDAGGTAGRGIFVEEYLPGPEYRVFIIGKQVYPVVALSSTGKWGIKEYGRRDLFQFDVVPESSATPLKELALRATEAGPGHYHYTNVDLRTDAEGTVKVLEVNALPYIPIHGGSEGLAVILQVAEISITDVFKTLLTTVQSSQSS